LPRRSARLMNKLWKKNSNDAVFFNLSLLFFPRD
jgi:hypothetical protein